MRPPTPGRIRGVRAPASLKLRRRGAGLRRGGGIRGVRAPASLKRQLVRRGRGELGRIRGVRAPASLKPHLRVARPGLIGANPGHSRPGLIQAHNRHYAIARTGGPDRSSRRRCSCRRLDCLLPDFGLRTIQAGMSSLTSKSEGRMQDAGAAHHGLELARLVRRGKKAT